mmetsp:Transcript_50217/g.141580  ORF Transcript_50217/g.141580 Transcript_50217/m.141580 type:complete len:426 (+) Transcript_50217:306-1583(+)
MELWADHAMSWHDATAKCLGDVQCAGLMFYRADGRHALPGSVGLYQGCGGRVDVRRKPEWEVVLRTGLWADSRGKISYVDPGSTHCCARVPDFSLGADRPEPHDARRSTKTLHFKWDGPGGLGNIVMRYWHNRAFAYFRGQPFQADPVNDAQVLRHFRTWVPEEKSPDARLMQAFRKLSRYPGFPGELAHYYPHAYATAPWRLFLDTMVEETAESARRILHGKNSSAKPADVAAVYIRCDIDIVGEDGSVGMAEYGLFPHRFVGQRLPQGISKVVLLLGVRYRTSKLCPRVIDDFQRYLTERGLEVEVREPGGGDTGGALEDDWAQLTTYQTVFSWQSTFSFTALIANPHRVFFPFNGGNMVIVEPPLGMQEACKTAHPRWSWVATDFLPGKHVSGMAWERIHGYLNSDSCDTAAVPCIPARESC